MEVDATSTQEPTFPPIRDGLLKIYAEIDRPTFSCVQFVSLYNLIYDFCTFKGTLGEGTSSNSFLLYTLLKEFLESFVASELYVPLQGKMGNAFEFVDSYKATWDSYLRFAEIVNNVFQYLNRFLVEKGFEKNTQIYPIDVLCLQSWKQELFSKFSPQIAGIFEAILAPERQQGQQPSNVSLVSFIHSAIVMENQLKMSQDSSTIKLAHYKESCEIPFIEVIKRFYQGFYQQFLSSNSFEAVVDVMHRMLNQEEERIKFYMHPSSNVAAKAVLYQVTLDKYCNELKQFLITHVSSYNLEALTLFYKTVCRYEGFMENFVPTIEAVLKDCFGKQYSTAAQSKDTVEHLAKLFFDTSLSVYNKYKIVLIEKAMNNDYYLATGADNAFKYALNKNAITGDSAQASENLAKYSDLLLKKSAKPLEENLNHKKRIEELIALFRYLEEKDVFQQHYSRYLSRRLINGTIESDELETEMMNKLQEVCGIEFVAKFQRMISDNALGKELNADFINSAFYDKTDGYYQVLCMGTWPLNTAESDVSFVPHQKIQGSMRQFSDYYVERHSGRKLTWLPQYCRGEVQATFGANSYILQVSLYQATILDLFNGAEKLSFAQIQQATSLSAETLSCIMEIFLKSKLMVGHQCSLDNFESIKNGVFEINPSYSSKKIRVNLNAPLRTEAKVDKEKAAKSVEADRTILIQAAIVRIMKAKKTLKHVNLVDETIRELETKFVPQIADIKHSIDTLIEREYLERSKESYDVLVYLA